MPWVEFYPSNRRLVDALVTQGHIEEKNVAVADAMLATDRKHYVPPAVGPSVDDGAAASTTEPPDDAYADRPLPIGFNATISAPRTHALQLSLLVEHAVRPQGARLLDVGAGSGYSTACLARMAGERGRVVGVEHIAELAALAEANVRRDDASLLASGRVSFRRGDGRVGASSLGPYDAIHCGASAAAVPQALIKQLAPGGRLVMPVGQPGSSQRLTVVDRDRATGKLHEHSYSNVILMPLSDEAAQLAQTNKLFGKVKLGDLLPYTRPMK